jgi:hypothetical protein
MSHWTHTVASLRAPGDSGLSARLHTRVPGTALHVQLNVHATGTGLPTRAPYSPYLWCVYDVYCRAAAGLFVSNVAYSVLTRHACVVSVYPPHPTRRDFILFRSLASCLRVRCTVLGACACALEPNVEDGREVGSLGEYIHSLLNTSTCKAYRRRLSENPESAGPRRFMFPSLAQLTARALLVIS